MTETTFKPGDKVVWRTPTGNVSVIVKEVKGTKVLIDDVFCDKWVDAKTLSLPTTMRSDL